MFIDHNELSQGYLSQIADYITKNTGATGSTPVIDMSGGAVATDAFVGDVSKRAGGDRRPEKQGKKYQFLKEPPAPVTFTSGEDKVMKIREKLLEVATGSTALDNLCAVVKESSRYHVSKVDVKEVHALSDILANHQKKKDSVADIISIFPLFDIVRLALAHPGAVSSASLAAAWSNALKGEAAGVLPYTVDALASPGAADIVRDGKLPMLALRALSNLFRNQAGKAVALTMVEDIVNGVIAPVINGADSGVVISKGLRSSATSMLINLSTLKGMPAQAESLLLSTLLHTLKSPSFSAEEADTKNVLIALGNIGLVNKGKGESGESSTVRDEISKGLRGSSWGGGVKEVGNEVSGVW